MDDFKEMLGAEIISITGGLLAGIGLVLFTNQLSLIPGLFILIPGFLEMRGAVGGSLASRISSGLFLGVIKPRIRKNSIIVSNALAEIFIILICSLILGLIAYVSSAYFFDIVNIKLIFISLIAGIVSVAMMPLTIFTTIYLFRKGHDPNNIMGPYVTTIGDLTSVFSFMIAIMVVG